MKRAVMAILFLLLGIYFFWQIQLFFIPNNQDRIPAIINGYKALEDNTVDAIFIGTSHVLYGISPMTIYEDTGLQTYSLGTAAQSLGLSYGLLKMAFRTQNPKVVMLDVERIFSTDYAEGEMIKQRNYALLGRSPKEQNNYWRWVLDALPFGIDKIEIAKEYLKTPYCDDITSLLFPIINYHTRWVDLAKEDFIPNHKGFYYAAGESNGVGINPALISVNFANEITDRLMRENIGYDFIYDKNKETVIEERKLSDPVYLPIIRQQDLEYLRKIHQLCDAHETELILMKIPTVFFPPLSSGAWTQIKSDMTKTLAKNENLEYIDFLYDYKDIVDFSTDTYDQGGHLNSLGAEKVAVALEPILTGRIPNGCGKASAIYDQMLTDYNKISKVMHLELETNYASYIDMIAESADDWLIFVTASDDYTSGMLQQDYDMIKEKLGVKLIDKGMLGDAYIAVLDRGEITHEELSDRRIFCEVDCLETQVTLTSSGTFHNQLGSIMIGNIEYALSRPGLNIVIYDYESKMVIDSAAINTQIPDKPVSHGDITPYFKEYELFVYTS